MSDNEIARRLLDALRPLAAAIAAIPPETWDQVTDALITHTISEVEQHLADVAGGERHE